MRFRDIPQFTPDGNYQINVSLASIERQIESLSEFQKLEMDPDFQRGHVWTEDKQIAYVEFLLRGGKSSRVIYWNCPSWPETLEGQPFQLVDGKQRLEACRRFIGNELKAFGCLFSEFTGPISLMTSLTFNINGLKSRAEVLQWYLDLNSGGVVHTDEEITKVRKLLEVETAQSAYDQEVGK